MKKSMKYLISFIAALILILLYSSCRTTAIGSVGNNVCKNLEKKTVLYVIFVDSKGTHSWNDFDIRSTLDSIQIAVDWIHKSAAENNINLNISVEHAEKNGKIPFKGKFKYETFSNTLYRSKNLINGIRLIDQWSDKIAKNVARSIKADSSSIVLSKNRSNNRERMIAKLRNKYKTDNIAVMYFINCYYENELSAAFHTGSNNDTEYAVVSTKHPPVIAHEFLHLFGAWDLYISPFDKGILLKHKKKKAMKNFPNEIMAYTHKRNIDSLNISQLTRYLIGWDTKLEIKYSNALLGRRTKLLEY